MHTKQIMKKTYIAPSIECMAYSTENMMALSIVTGSADNSTVLSNYREAVEWEEWDDDEF